MSRVLLSAFANLGASRARVVRMFMAFACAYFLSALVRAAPATMADVLTRELALSAGDLGLLAGAYFLGFSLTQLPLGHALDRYGPRRVLVVLLVLASLACAWFARARGLGELVVSRAIIGVGVSACLMAPLTAFRLTLSPQHQLRANAWMLMTGSLGMLASTLPLHWLLPVWGWRGTADVIAAGILGAIGLLVAWVPAAIPGPTVESSRADGDIGYAQIFGHPRFVQLAPVGFFVYGGMIAVQTLWVAPWLSRVGGWSPAQTAAGLFTINGMMLVTFFVWGIVMPKVARSGGDGHRLMRWGMVLPLAILPVILVLGERANAFAWAIWCVSCSVVSLSQPLVAQEFPPRSAGRALSAYNLVLFVGIFVVQWGIGVGVDAFAARGADALQAFRGAMIVFWGASLIAYGWYLLREPPASIGGAADNLPS